MGKEIRLASTLLIGMDFMGTRVTSQLPYDNNMLYLPLPDTAEIITGSDSTDKDEIVIAALEKKKTRQERVKR
jgi:hypothetical protein